MQKYDASYGKSWMFFPDEDGNPQVIKLSQPQNDEQGLKFALVHDNADSKITFYLYNK
jgi:hypothetical protein